MGKGAQVKNEISIIIRQTNERLARRLIDQLGKLDVPAGWSADVQVIGGARSLAAAYNEGMKHSRGDYRLYIDEAVAVLAPSLLRAVIELFNGCQNAGIIGWYGSEIPLDGDIRRAASLYGTYCRRELNGEVTVHRGKNPIFYQTVGMVDRAVVAVRGDIQWDEAAGDRFAVAAQCLKMKAAGRDIIVPMQNDCAICQVEREPVYAVSGNEQSSYEPEQRSFFKNYKKLIQPLVSIIIPAYNQPEFLTAAVESALAQDYDNIEIVIGDDSTDKRTKAIMEEYAKQHANLKYYYHGGPLGENGLRNFNFVLNHCHGQYVNFLLHDDLYRPKKISRMMKCYQQDLEETIGIVTSSRNLIDGKGKEIAAYMNPWLPEQDVIEEGETIGRRIIMNFSNYIGEVTTALIRKRDLKQLAKKGKGIEEKYEAGRFCGYLETSMGDVSVWLEMARKGKRCAFIRETLSSFRSHAGQNTWNPGIIANSVRDWLAFAVLAWVNGAFFRSADECRRTLITWKNWLPSIETRLQGTRQESSELNSFLKKTARLIEEKRYAEACLGVIRDIKNRQPDGAVIMPDNYRGLCERLNNELH